MTRSFLSNKLDYIENEFIFLQLAAALLATPLLLLRKTDSRSTSDSAKIDKLLIESIPELRSCSPLQRVSDTGEQQQSRLNKTVLSTDQVRNRAVDS